MHILNKIVYWYVDVLLFVFLLVYVFSIVLLYVFTPDNT